MNDLDVFLDKDAPIPKRMASLSSPTMLTVLATKFPSKSLKLSRYSLLLCVDNFCYTIRHMVYPILVVEDDPKIAHIVKVYLEGAGFRVIHVDRGAKALEEARKEKPLLVILDLMLPDMSGEVPMITWSNRSAPGNWSFGSRPC
jgi:hypothetical protein